MYPSDLRYTREHEWVRLEKGEAVVGITHYAQDELGDVVFVELPAVGAELKQMEVFGVVESVKAVSDLYSPVSGKVIAANVDLERKPEMVNEDPYGQGWMIRVKPAHPAELDALLDAAAYKALIDELRA